MKAMICVILGMMGTYAYAQKDVCPFEIHCPDEDRNAIRTWIQGTKIGDLWSYYNLGVYGMEHGGRSKGEIQLALKYIRHAATHNLLEAQLYLANFYRRGHAFGHYVQRVDKINARHWYEKAAEKGSRKAHKYQKQTSYGEADKYKFGTAYAYLDPRVVAKAVKISARQQDGDSQYVLAKHLLRYDTLRKNPFKNALPYFRKAAQQDQYPTIQEKATIWRARLCKTDQKAIELLMPFQAPQALEAAEVLAPGIIAASFVDNIPSGQERSTQKTSEDLKSDSLEAPSESGFFSHSPQEKGLQSTALQEGKSSDFKKEESDLDSGSCTPSSCADQPHEIKPLPPKGVGPNPGKQYKAAYELAQLTAWKKGPFPYQEVKILADAGNQKAQKFYGIRMIKKTIDHFFYEDTGSSYQEILWAKKALALSKKYLEPWIQDEDIAVWTCIARFMARVHCYPHKKPALKAANSLDAGLIAELPMALEDYKRVEEFAGQGYTYAQMVLGWGWLLCEATHQKGVTFLEGIAKDKNLDAYRLIGHFYEKEGAREKALAYYLKGVGHLPAMMDLGRYYGNAQNWPADISDPAQHPIHKAIKVFKEVIEISDIPQAYLELGNLYMQEIGGRVLDKALAMEMYTKAGEFGEIQGVIKRAESELLLTEQGMYNVPKALKIYEEAYEKYPQFQGRLNQKLGDLYGAEGIKQDIGKAKVYYEKAITYYQQKIKAGDSQPYGMLSTFRTDPVPYKAFVQEDLEQAYIMMKLGDLLMLVDGTPTSPTLEGLAWYKKAADLNHITAQLSLGQWLCTGRMGTGVPQDITQGVSFLEKALANLKANKGTFPYADPDMGIAYYLLGQAYYQGKDIAKAYEMYTQVPAKSQYCLQAQVGLAVIHLREPDYQDRLHDALSYLRAPAENKEDGVIPLLEELEAKGKKAPHGLIDIQEIQALKEKCAQK